jgi:hypothetical protein
MPLGAVNPVEAASGIPPAPSRPPISTVEDSQPSANLSPSGALMSRLQLLAQQDPGKLTAIANDASQALRSAATSATGETAKGLNQLAESFAQAASSGDVSTLRLGAPPRTRHHHATTAVKSYAGSSSILPQGAAAKLEAVSLQVDEALGLSPPPLGPWGNQ